jgi:ABC-type branched-subunit amino acid transport system ATPase component
VSLEVEEGSIYGLIGPNGAGKTTLVNVVTGYVPFQSGRAWLGSDELTGLPAHRIAAAGIARTFQNIRLFKDLTAQENVLVGMHARRNDDTLAQIATLPVFRRDQRARLEEARRLMDSVGLGALIRARLDADQRGTRFTIRGQHSSVRRLLEITDLASWFEGSPQVMSLPKALDIRLEA